jgi:aspartyl protease family protein
MFPIPITINPEWHHLALYALGAAFVLIVLFNVPYVGRLLRVLFSFGLLAFSLFLLLQQAPFNPSVGRFTSRLGLDDQVVDGDTVRLKPRGDGHYWARVTINGVPRRMLIDTGATMTALSEDTAQRAGIHERAELLPVILQTANGDVAARTGSIKRLKLGGIEARNLKVVISASFGDTDVLGMNFLSRLGSWRVEKGTLVLEPRDTEGASKRSGKHDRHDRSAD